MSRESAGVNTPLRKCLVAVLILLSSALARAQEDDGDPLPIEDPFIIRSRINILYNNSVSQGQEGTQQMLVNPVLALGPHSSLQLTAPMVWYQPGQSGNRPGQGFGDVSVQYFHRFETSSTVSHGLGVNVAFDTATTNLGGGATTLGGGYAFDYKPNDDNKLVVIAGYSHSMGQTTPGDPTRQAVLRIQGYHFFDSAYAGLELRNQFNLYTGSYEPFALFSGGGEVFDGLQLWGSVRLPLNSAARDNNDRLNYSIGITVPL